jgi:hypothetical protein
MIGNLEKHWGRDLICLKKIQLMCNLYFGGKKTDVGKSKFPCNLKISNQEFTSFEGEKLNGIQKNYNLLSI